MTGRRRRVSAMVARLVGAAALAVPVALGLGAPAGAVSPTKTGWWNELMAGPLTAPSTASKSQLQVGNGLQGPTAFSALMYQLPSKVNGTSIDKRTPALLTLTVAPGSAVGTASVEACLVPNPGWKAGGAQPASAAPKFYCSQGAVLGVPSADGSTESWSLGPALQSSPGIYDVALAPAPMSHPFAVAYDQPTANSLQPVSAPAAHPKSGSSPSSVPSGSGKGTAPSSGSSNVGPGSGPSNAGSGSSNAGSGSGSGSGSSATPSGGATSGGLSLPAPSSINLPSSGSGAGSGAAPGGFAPGSSGLSSSALPPAVNLPASPAGGVTAPGSSSPSSPSSGSSSGQSGPSATSPSTGRAVALAASPAGHSYGGLSRNASRTAAVILLLGIALALVLAATRSTRGPRLLGSMGTASRSAAVKEGEGLGADGGPGGGPGQAPPAARMGGLGRFARPRVGRPPRV